MASNEIAGRDARKALQRATIEIDPAAPRRSVRASDRDLSAAKRGVFVCVQHAKGPLRLAQPVDLAVDALGIAQRRDGAGERPEIVEAAAKRSSADKFSLRAQAAMHRMAARGAERAVDEQQRAAVDGARSTTAGRFFFPSPHRREGSPERGRTSPP